MPLPGSVITKSMQKKTSSRATWTTLVQPVRDKENELDAFPPFPGGSTSLFHHPEISAFVRWSIPIIIIGTIIMVVKSNIDVGASVFCVLSIGDDTSLFPEFTYETKPLFAFTLQNSVTDMWEAGAYFLSALIAVFSGFWPYFKLIILLACWVEVYKIGPFVLDIMVSPQLGFNLFLWAALISLFLGHVILAFHRRVLVGEMTFLSPAKSAMRHSTMPLHGGSTRKAFAFDVRGLAGFTLDITGDDSYFPFSLWDLALQLPDSSVEPNGFTTRFVQASFIIFSVVMPVFYLLAALVLWNVPFSLQRQHQLYHLCEVLFAWSALEVFVLSVIVSVLQIGIFTQFIVGDYCNVINWLLEHIPYVSVTFLESIPLCMDIQTDLQEGCWLLFCSGLVFVLVCFSFNAATHAIISHKLEDGAIFHSPHSEYVLQRSRNRRHQKIASQVTQRTGAVVKKDAAEVELERPGRTLAAPGLGEAWAPSDRRRREYSTMSTVYSEEDDTTDNQEHQEGEKKEDEYAVRVEQIETHEPDPLYLRALAAIGQPATRDKLLPLANFLEPFSKVFSESLWRRQEPSPLVKLPSFSHSLNPCWDLHPFLMTMSQAQTWVPTRSWSQRTVLDFPNQLACQTEVVQVYVLCYRLMIQAEMIRMTGRLTDCTTDCPSRLND
eukprot:g34053.t1